MTTFWLSGFSPHSLVCFLLPVVQAGLVTAAADSSVSAKARRKRKQQQEDGSAAAAAPTAATAAWANLKLQQRCYGDAWLAFLRTDLPHDIYRKVNTRQARSSQCAADG
jgi:U3 small nucleolar RNA-associated protein 19